MCYQEHVSFSRPGMFQLDLKWSCSQAKRKVVGFSININAQGYAMGGFHIICLPCHLIPLSNGFNIPNRFYFIHFLLCRRSVQ